MEKKYLDLVVSGDDFSGTSTQIDGLIKYFRDSGRKVRDIRGTETDAMFHAEAMKSFNKFYASLDEFSNDRRICPSFIVREGRSRVHSLVRKNKISSMVHNDVSEYINPDSADVWVMEEPTRRGAGQTVRTIELYRSKFNSESNQAAAALAHQAYRTEEFLRFRKVLRESGKIILRSRSEESACYQIFDDESLPGGVSRQVYMTLPGHKIAFGNPPTHIFVVCGPENWKPEDYLELKKQRNDRRIDDDYEKNASYEIMVNKRYATEWLENLYEEGCRLHGGKVPEITRFDIYHPKEQIIKEMTEKLKSVEKSITS
jgi:thymidylate kinase